jgi:hypothetical protein
MHGHCSWEGGREFEIYENSFILNNNINYNDPINIRGGTGVIYNNRITNDGSYADSTIRFPDFWLQEISTPDFCNDVTGGSCHCCSYPCTHQIGRGQNEVLDPVYIWGNTLEGGEGDLPYVADSSSSCPCNPDLDIHDFVQAGRDYYTNQAKPGYVALQYPHPLVGGGQGPVCNNDVIESGEICDGTDLGGETCQTQGFDSGILGCLTDCSGYDTSGCSSTSGISVTLNSPIDNEFVVSGLVDFSCSASDQTDLESLALWGNWSGWGEKDKANFANNLLTNPGAEDGFAGNGVALGWTDDFDGSTQVTYSQDTGKEGSAQRIDVTSVGSWGFYLFQRPGLQLGEIYTISFWYKSQGPGYAWVSVTDAPFTNRILHENLSYTNGEWKYYTFTFTYNNTDADMFRFYSREIGTYWFDNVQIELGSQNSSFSPTYSQTSVNQVFKEQLGVGTFEWNCQGENSVMETAWGEPVNRVVNVCHRADTATPKCCVYINEIVLFIGDWKQGLGGITMIEVMSGIGLYNSGQGCP